jgi:hypothetical protein
MPRIIVFDVNETLLDVKALEPHFVRLFGDGRTLREWFSTVLLYSEVVTLAGPYVEFGQIGRAALDMMPSREAWRLRRTNATKSWEACCRCRRIPTSATACSGFATRDCAWRR